ncbi:MULTISPECIES: CHAD domain-containing protein [unclassified Aureimonas]|uniref:CHAD domain-containing protein n=1 Tax=unclassified Aureimonas TaxID=2615206 RepID=UPI0007014204|nr:MULTISPECIES: CHAD domain-containing protein [unclassified Aureimonas]KQT62594.1 hypothetical protein ASG62_23050 [Aureimonas sp. Leaf427]KQT73181.1 hypothetical protein ASG54_17985 [Aureimonas sp. Leaf460]
MAYKLHPERSLSKEIGRVALEELGAAVEDLDNASGDRGEAIHDVRKRLKRLRGLLRLIRRSDPDLYRSENVRFRDTAKSLSAVRDRTALIESLDALKERFGEDAAVGPMSNLREALDRRRQAAVDEQGSLSKKVADVVDTLKKAQKEWKGWGSSHEKASARAALLDGLKENYRRARAGLEGLKRHGDAEAFHELRKRVKYHAMHLRLLSPAWPEVLEPARKVADGVADDLGRDHDYAVMRAEIAADPAAHASHEDREAVTALIDTYQDELRRSALEACARLFAEKPAAFRRRMESYLDAAGSRKAKHTSQTWRAADKQAHLEAPT